jgi:hypothetical protein
MMKPIVSRSRSSPLARFNLTDPRAKYWLEAHRNIQESHQYDKATQGYWLNLAVAGVNALMAALPDSVLEDVMVDLARQEQLGRLNQKTVQGKIKEDLGGK